MTDKYAFIDAEYATPAGEEASAPTITQMCGDAALCAGLHALLAAAFSGE